MGTKGARLTCHLTLAGRLLVLFPRLGLRTVSRRIGDEAERARLQTLLERLAASGLPPSPAGLVARTAAAGADEASLERDARWLLERWREIEADAEGAGAPTVLHDEPELPLRLLRDAPREGYDRVVFDEADDHARAQAYVRQVDPALAGSMELHRGAGALFDDEGLDHELHRALRPRVWLKSGGHLVIEETEALVSIDVNTGKFVGRRHLEETLLQTNLEAAHEIVRQLRLRDLGGIVVIDFIDMESADSRRQVTEVLQAGLAADRARTQIVDISELGLLHLARRRTRPGPGHALLRDCPVCHGRGHIASPDALAARALSEIQRLPAGREDVRVTLAAHPDVVRSLRETPGLAGVELVEDPELAPDAYDLRRG